MFEFHQSKLWHFEGLPAKFFAREVMLKGFGKLSADTEKEFFKGTKKRNKPPFFEVNGGVWGGDSEDFSLPAIPLLGEWDLAFSKGGLIKYE